jgi:Xaa-Pro dipeptidase
MVTRRGFMVGAGIAAGATLVPELSFAQRGEQRPTGPLPESITSLKSMRDQARPITKDERLARIERARKLMAATKLDAILITGGTTLSYFADMRWGQSERFFGLTLPLKGEPFFVAPAFEEDRAREQIARGPLPSAQVYTWQEDENPYKLVAQGLRERSIAAGRLGMEETVKYVFSDGIAQAAPALKITSATPVTAGCRGVKEAHEIELMRLASKVTLLAYAAAWKGLRDGMTQGEFSSLISAAHSRLGFPGGASVQVGEFTALPHGSMTPQTIREGSIILIDGGCAVEGYQSDLSRTFILGKPTDKMKQVFDIIHRTQQIALAAAKPGAQCQAVDAAARKFVSESGYGPDYKYFTHRLGHGLGMDGHEWPYLVRGNTQPLVANTTTSNEPGIYIKGEFGLRLEDDMLVTENGAELLTPQSPSLEEPYANVTIG